MRLTVTCAIAIAATTSQAQPIALLDVEAANPGSPVLKLIIIPTGDEPIRDARIRFLSDGDPVRRPGLVHATVPAPRQGQDVRIVSFGPVAPPTRSVQVEAQIGGAPWQALGTLTVGDDGPRLDRACSPTPGEQPILTVAACEMLGSRRLIVRAGFFNCGATFESDLWAFLHFEPNATGEEHATLAPLGLHAIGKATDSATWAADEVTVLTFGPYTVPDEAELPIYLRAGLYDYHGDGARVPLVGVGDATRVLLGRIVERDGVIAFERSPLPEEGE